MDVLKTRAELHQLLEIAEQDCPEYYPFLLCLARTGMRLGEALALEWRDVDWVTRVILVRRSQRKNRVSEPKSGKARRVDMSQQLAEVLLNLKSLQETEAVVNGAMPPERLFSIPEHTDPARQLPELRVDSAASPSEPPLPEAAHPAAHLRLNAD